ncbi:MAG: hypothetical protein U0791_25455 [Gemmataceae bacterium]
MNAEAQELLARVRKLPPDDQKLLAFDVLDAIEESELIETVQRRSAEIAAGKDVLLTREEAEAEVRAKMRELGFEL